MFLSLSTFRVPTSSFYHVKGVTGSGNNSLITVLLSLSNFRVPTSSLHDVGGVTEHTINCKALVLLCYCDCKKLEFHNMGGVTDVGIQV